VGGKEGVLFLLGGVSLGGVGLDGGFEAVEAS